ncbi:MAG: C40 family peptidase [Actinobacteria bacterium]|nr:C40 family peptidase [Actinomycetota bacterium]
MTDTQVSGRHRSPGRHNPLTEIAAMVGRVGESGAKASAVLAASGGLVAAFALPAQAATSSSVSTASSKAAAAPALLTTTAPAFTAEKPAAPAVAAAPSVVAPQSSTPAVATTVGVVGVTAVEKPAPPPVVAAPRTTTTTTQASRSTTRTATATSTTAASTAAAPAAPVRASVGGGVLDIAAAYSGIPYVYGGSTPAGFDCSGFTQFVFGQAGISLPRTATAQMFATTRVSDPQPGDLVFFGDGSYAYHVGIYAGGGMMYDSPRTGLSSGLRSIWSSNVIYGRV